MNKINEVDARVDGDGERGGWGGVGGGPVLEDDEKRGPEAVVACVGAEVRPIVYSHHHVNRAAPPSLVCFEPAHHQLNLR